jgi:hypothetical protein
MVICRHFRADLRPAFGVALMPRRFPPPWSVDDPDMKPGQDCYIVRDANGHALALGLFRGQTGAAHCGAPAHSRRGAADRSQHRQAA